MIRQRNPPGHWNRRVRQRTDQRRPFDPQKRAQLHTEVDPTTDSSATRLSRGFASPDRPGFALIGRLFRVN